MTLTDADIEAAFWYVVTDQMLELLDPRLGTNDAAAWLRSWGVQRGCITGCDDLPYPEWSRWIDVDTRGAQVRVQHHHEVVREGRVSWNLLANRATVTVCRRRGDPVVQPALF